MGFCHRCGEITTGRCNKCGGRSVASTISNIVSEGTVGSSISIVDRWQSQYADTILSLPEEIKMINNKTSPPSATTKRIPVTQSTFYNPPLPLLSASSFTNNKMNKQKVCTCCSQPCPISFVEQGLSYCKKCRVELFNKGECPTCQMLVSPMDSFIEYASNIWHKSCFNCIHCTISLDTNPLIDLENRPCCESCFMSQSGNQRSRGRRVSLSQQHQQPQSSYSSQSSSVSSQSSSASSITSQMYQSRSTNRPRIDRDLFHQPTNPNISPKTCSPLHEMMQDLSIAIETKSPSLPPPVPSKKSITTTTTTTATRNSSISSRPCYYCHEPLGDSTQKKIKIPLTDEKDYAWFHKSCFLCSQCHLPFQGECATDGISFYHPGCKFTSTPCCFGCKKTIGTDAFQFNHKMYHFNCFKCYGNGCKIALGQPVYEVGKRPFCQTCYTLSNKTTTTTTTTRKLLGGSKTCPKCNQTISIMDDIQGPLTSRWHKKCLVCIKCNKQLDSAAKMKQLNVYCTNCF